MPKIHPEDYINKTYNYLTILSFAGSNKYGNKRVNAQCKCNIIKTYDFYKIVTGKTKSCGCYQKEKTIEKSLTHGLSHHSLYMVWADIKRRCYNNKSKPYKNYGKRGITMHSEWFSNFKIFFDWCIENGWQKGLEIDRINNNGNYEPANCRFVTSKINSRNRRKAKMIVYNGEPKSLAEWCQILNINYHLAWDRLNNNWSIEKTFKN